MRLLEVKPAVGIAALARPEQRQSRTRRSKRAGQPSVGRLLAALLGTVPVTLLAAALIIRVTPPGSELGFGLAYLAAIPLWTYLVCQVLVARTSFRAWTWCLVASAAVASALYLIPGHRPDLQSSSPPQ